jgi:anti-sigma factor RsiW
MHELLHPYFDDELDATQRTAFEDHLGHCPDCARELAAQRELRSALRDEELYHRPPASLATRVRASLPQPIQPSARPRRRLAWLSAAAIVTGLALGVAGLALIVRAPSAEDRLAQEATANHARALQAGHLLDIDSTNRHRVKPWFQPRIDFAPPVVDLAEQGFPLAGGRLDFLDGRTVAALVYHRHEHVINLFIWPAKADGESVIRTTSHRGYSVVYWSKSGLNFWAVSDLNAQELREFARLMRDEPP